jgi:predicted nuclease of restriction endonuclease-like RecB superfamily
LKSVDPLTPEAAIERYNLGLAQAILLRALRVTVKVEGEGAPRMRKLFRAARFHQLIHVVKGDPEGGYTIELDGPFSLFDSVQRYGLRLALFLPSVLACRSFAVRADVLWGKERTPTVFEIGPDDELVPSGLDTVEENADLEVFRAAFARLESEWEVKPSERIFALPGEVVCVPDLVFENRETGEEVYLEVFGFWSRAAVWQRVELLRKGTFPARILLAVGKQLRVSEEVLGEEDAGEIYVYGRAMSPRAVLDRLRAQR